MDPSTKQVVVRRGIDPKLTRYFLLFPFCLMRVGLSPVTKFTVLVHYLFGVFGTGLYREMYKILQTQFPRNKVAERECLITRPTPSFYTVSLTYSEFSALDLSGNVVMSTFDPLLGGIGSVFNPAVDTPDPIGKVVMTFPSHKLSGFL
jgi:hypothetical protein